MWQAVEKSDGRLIVSRSAPMRGIAELTWDGKIIRSYGDQSGAQKMNNSHSFFVDSTGYVLVADSGNERIQVVNPSLTDARTLQLPFPVNEKQTFALWYNESSGRLYSGSKCMRAFEGVINLDTLFDIDNNDIDKLGFNGIIKKPVTISFQTTFFSLPYTRDERVAP